MKRFELILAICLVGLVLVYPVWAAEGSDAATYNWSGFYLGAHGAYSWANSGSTSINTVTGESVGGGSSSSTNGSGGIQIGNDFMLTRDILLGLDARVSYLNTSNDDTTSNAAGTTVHMTHGQTDWSEALLVRLGYVFRNWLFYGRGGAYFNQGDITRTQVAGTTGLATPGTVEKVSNNRVGWTIGAGVEYGFAPNWSAFLEYRYNTTPTYTINYPIAQRSTDINAQSNGIVFGLNYKFNWGSTLFE
jgi:high affinity Mn2+ porin